VFKVNQQKTQDGEIESIQGPAKKCGEEGVPLDPGYVSESGARARSTSVRTSLNRGCHFGFCHLCEYTPRAERSSLVPELLHVSLGTGGPQRGRLYRIRNDKRAWVRRPTRLPNRHPAIVAGSSIASDAVSRLRN
jgi:hypothetical protein